MNASQLTFSKALWSTIGKKVITGITGLGLVLFITGHLLGNFQLLLPNPDYFNIYAYKLMSLGPLLYLVEAGLTLFFLSHAYTGITVWASKRKARPVNYALYNSQGGKSKQSMSSRSMAITGLVILIFIPLHLWHFKFGAYYETTIDGVVMRDLFRTVVEYYQNPFNVAFYTAVMVLLGVHLRHGIWSAFQSLAAVKPRWIPALYASGGLVGAAYALGFILIPIWIFIAY